jgi:oxygen-independent coproporphyrinogen-3 oxidase
VQDFYPLIQKAIGREQSFELTAEVAAMIRACGVESLNADILFGLPHQTQGRIARSVDLLLGLSPDRVALYGYAHVPWMSRRQQMIPAEAIPAAQDRLALFETARKMFDAAGYAEIGIDHFARPTDGLARAQAAGTLRRNFQGYTDDTAPVLVGLGASSISRFPQGFAQNASGTADHTRAIREGRFSTHRGHVFSGEDLLRGRIIEALMCDFHVSRAELLRDFDTTPARLDALFAEPARRFGAFFRVDSEGATISAEGRPLARMIARTFDAYDPGTAQHSAAI